VIEIEVKSRGYLLVSPPSIIKDQDVWIRGYHTRIILYTDLLKMSSLSANLSFKFESLLSSPSTPIVHHNKSQEGISCVGGQIADDSGKIKQTFF
jgi:hypothetical protein